MKFELGRCVVRVCGVFVGCRFVVGSMFVRCWLWCDKGELWGCKRAIKKDKRLFVSLLSFVFGVGQFPKFFFAKIAYAACTKKQKVVLYPLPW
jgi:hypothetical protein